MCKVSVIVPVYNVVDYLRQAVDSVLNQDLKDLEVILVDDGSTDGSSAICEIYAHQEHRVKVIHKEHGGLSDARNVGMSVATGKYLFFLDADDWLAPSAISTLYNVAEKQHCEIVQGGFYYAYSTYLLYDQRWFKNGDTFLLTKEEAMAALMENRFLKNFAWGKLYERTLVVQHPFPVGKFFEDSYWQHEVMHGCKTYGVVSTPLYYYRQRANSISGKFSLRNLDLLKGYEERITFISREYPSLLPSLVALYWETAYHLYEHSLKQNDAELRQAYQNYWTQINEKYQKLFEKYLTHHRLYRLVMSRSRFLKLYQLERRIYGRFFAPSLKRTNLSC
jgi:glycosyltransferase involved in cell wall biosynthesis